MDKPPPKLLEQVREVLRIKHYSIRTETSYVDWIKRFILFHQKRHPKEMGLAEVEAFLSYLAVDQQVAASTQNQALAALLFLYREVLHQEFGQPTAHLQAKQSKNLPTVLTKQEVRRVMSYLSGNYLLMTQLLYGCGLRLMECLREGY